MLGFKRINKKDDGWFAYIRVVIHWAIIALITILMVDDIIGVIIKWWIVLLHPAMIFNDYHAVMSDLFSVLLLYELLALFRVISPVHLLDLVLTLAAREMMLSNGTNGMLDHVIAFSILLLIRLLWNRLAKEEHDDMMDANE